MMVWWFRRGGLVTMVLALKLRYRVVVAAETLRCVLRSASVFFLESPAELRSATESARERDQHLAINT